MVFNTVYIYVSFSSSFSLDLSDYQNVCVELLECSSIESRDWELNVVLVPRLENFVVSLTFGTPKLSRSSIRGHTSRHF